MFITLGVTCWSCYPKISWIRLGVVCLTLAFSQVYAPDDVGGTHPSLCREDYHTQISNCLCGAI